MCALGYPSQPEDTCPTEDYSDYTEYRIRQDRLRDSGYELNFSCGPETPKAQKDELDLKIEQLNSRGVHVILITCDNNAALYFKNP